jgi:hypothetical protein
MALHFLDHHSPGAQTEKRKHEQRIREALDNHGIQYQYQFRVRNRNEAGGISDKHFGGDLYIDFLVHTESGDVVLLEVDQMQHKSYRVKTECQRMQTITNLLRQSNLCLPDCSVIWLRYNPDSYTQGTKRYVAVDAVHQAEPCLVRYISSLQGGVVDVDGGATKRHNCLQIVYVRYDKHCTTSNEPCIASDMDYFPELRPFVRTLHLSECAVAVQAANIVIKKESREQEEEQEQAVNGAMVPMDDDDCNDDEYHHMDKRQKVNGSEERDESAPSNKLRSDSKARDNSWDGAIQHCDLWSPVCPVFTTGAESQIIAECIDSATGETCPKLLSRNADNEFNFYVTLDNLPSVLKLQGTRAKCHFHEKFKKYTKESALPNYVLLHEDPHTQKGRKNTAFAPADHVLAFLRDRRSLSAAALVKRIDDEIAKRTHLIQLKDAEERIGTETERANEAERRAEHEAGRAEQEARRAEDEAHRANLECELRVRQEAEHKRQIEALKQDGIRCSKA